MATHTDWAWENAGPYFDHSTSLVLLWLARRADQTGDSRLTGIGQQYLADRLGISVRTVYRCVRQLSAVGLVTFQKRWDPDTGAALPIVYTLHPDRFLSLMARKVEEIDR